MNAELLRNLRAINYKYNDGITDEELAAIYHKAKQHTDALEIELDEPYKTNERALQLAISISNEKARTYVAKQT